MKAKKEIFKEYDVRGQYPNELNEKTAYEISKAFVWFLNLKPGGKIVIAKDRRPSSPKLAKAIISGITDSGINVIDIGTVYTPILYYAVPALKAQGGIMVTGSHIAENFNGMKFIMANAEPVGGKEIKKVFFEFKEPASKTKGNATRVDMTEPYLEMIFSGFNPKKKINAIIEDMEPTKKYLPLSPSDKPDFYIGFDYDADRLLIKGKNKKLVRGDALGAVIADQVAQKDDAIVCDIRCSHQPLKYFENKGIKIYPSRVGHFNIKKLMRQKNAIFGMEISGHYYFQKFNYSESPFYALRKIIEAMEKTNKSLEELTAPFSQTFNSGIINIPSDNTEKLIKTLSEKYKNGAQNFADGLTVEFSNWWFNIRPSHTEPLVRMVIEATHQPLLEQKKKEILDTIQNL